VKFPPRIQAPRLVRRYARRVQDHRLEPARVTDAALLAVMSQRFVESGLVPAWSAARIRWHTRHPESVVLTARIRVAPIGFAIMRYGEDIAHLNLLAVDPAYRRRGVGRSLLRWLEETALTAGTFIIGLELRAGNEAARAFYRALGYRELGEIPGYYQGVESALRMVRDVRARCEPTPGTPQQTP
jgi:ribosomal-protein-alanine N-acetyltransferase